MSLNNHVPLLIIGASMRGLGEAFAARDALVLESGIGTGREFIGSYKYSESGYRPSTPLGEKLWGECKSRNAMDNEGKMHLPALQPILMNLIRQVGLDVRWLSSVVRVARCGGQYEVSYYDAAGMHVVTTDAIVDTTSRCASAPGRFGPSAKSLNMIVSPGENLRLLRSTASYRIAYGRFQSEAVLKYPLNVESDWIAARHRLFQFWLKRPEELKNFRFVTLAEEFDMEYALAGEEVGKEWHWFPSAYLDHPLKAFDEGVRSAGRRGTK